MGKKARKEYLAAIFGGFCDFAGVDAGRGGGEQPFMGAYLLIIEDGGEFATSLACATMGFVRHDQIKGWDGCVGLGGCYDGGRLVGGENHAIARATEEVLYFIRRRGDGEGEVGNVVDSFIVALYNG